GEHRQPRQQFAEAQSRYFRWDRPIWAADFLGGVRLRVERIEMRAAAVLDDEDAGALGRAWRLGTQQLGQTEADGADAPDLQQPTASEQLIHRSPHNFIRYKSDPIFIRYRILFLAS